MHYFVTIHSQKQTVNYLSIIVIFLFNLDLSPLNVINISVLRLTVDICRILFSDNILNSGLLPQNMLLYSSYSSDPMTIPISIQ